ncbi:uncharacterized protein LOC129041630 [Pongo pygmaeus]|uniref:uncharacterized protein LOC129041630 n=1 Tax=Pongo pygmaeus TaxID=9600 RepID=UPI0023E2C296|nr:uncharacterized protein LOC129041630 [Pongo pygmaeus]
MVLRGVRLMKWRDEKTSGTDCVEAVILLVTLLWEKKEAFHVGFNEGLQYFPERSTEQLKVFEWEEEKQTTATSEDNTKHLVHSVYTRGAVNFLVEKELSLEKYLKKPLK